MTTPELFTVALVLSLLLHVPPEAPSVSEIWEPVQTDEAPVIEPALGTVTTVTDAVAEEEQPEVVTV